MGYGGRRPGAGAPRGNINGLRGAKRSGRYYNAIYYVGVIPPIRPYLKGARPRSSPGDRRLFYRFLEAARWTIEANPDLSDHIDVILERHRTGRVMQQDNLPGGTRLAGAKTTIKQSVNQTRRLGRS